MMPEWHQLESSSSMPQQLESTKKKTLKSSSRSFWFSTGLLGRRFGICKMHLSPPVAYAAVRSKAVVLLLMTFSSPEPKAHG